MLHLADAKLKLDSIPKKVASDGTRLLADLRRHFAELTNAYRAQSEAGRPPILTEHLAAPTLQTDPDRTAHPAAWTDVFSVVERDLALLIGAGAMTAGTTVTKGESGAVASPPPADNAGAPAGDAPSKPVAIAPGLAEDVIALTGMVRSKKVSELGLKDLDPAVRTALDQFRTELELFYASTMGDLSGVEASTP